MLNRLIVIVVACGAVTFATNTGARADVKTGLIAHWTLDEQSGLVAADSSGHGYDMKLKRAQKWEAGKVKGGLRFLFDDESVYVNSKKPFVPEGSTFTLSAWVKNDKQVKDMQRYLSLMYYVPGEPEVEQAVIRHKEGNLGCYLGHKGFKHLQAPAAYKVGDWHHVAFTWDGTTQRLYSDGVEIGHLAEGSFRSGTALVLGSNMEGALDDVRIHGRPLSAADIKELYTAGSGHNAAH